MQRWLVSFISVAIPDWLVGYPGQYAENFKANSESAGKASISDIWHECKRREGCWCCGFALPSTQGFSWVEIVFLFPTSCPLPCKEILYPYLWLWGYGCTASQQGEIHPCPTVGFICRVCVDPKNMRKGRDIQHVQAERFQVPMFQFCPLLFFFFPGHKNSWSFQDLGAGPQPQTYLCWLMEMRSKHNASPWDFGGMTAAKLINTMNTLCFQSEFGKYK